MPKALRLATDRLNAPTSFSRGAHVHQFHPYSGQQSMQTSIAARNLNVENDDLAANKIKTGGEIPPS